MSDKTEAQRLADLHESLASNYRAMPLQQLFTDTAAELRRLDAVEAQWAALSQDDGKAAREIERLKAAPARGPVAVVSGYYGGRCVVLPIDPERVFNAGTAFYTTPPASRPAPVQEPVALEMDGKQLTLGESLDEAIAATERSRSNRLNAVLVAAKNALYTTPSAEPQKGGATCKE